MFDKNSLTSDLNTIRAIFVHKVNSTIININPTKTPVILSFYKKVETFNLKKVKFSQK